MRFRLETTKDGSLTLFDQEVGESFKSKHAALTESEVVFFAPGIRENAYLNQVSDFRILELGFGLGTNFSHCRKACLDFSEQSFNFTTIERDLAGAQLFSELGSADSSFVNFVGQKAFIDKNFSASLIVGEFAEVLQSIATESVHAIFFDPFSPKTNPQAWEKSIFEECGRILAPEGRLVTYSVSRVAKDGCAAAGLSIFKRDLPEILQKRNALLAIKAKKLGI